MTQSTIILDSITELDASKRGQIVICGSHGGANVAKVALSFGVRALLVNDAGVGRQRAGVAALPLFESYNRPAAALCHLSARIGDGADCAQRGIISSVNQVASGLGVRIGQSATEAALLMSASGSSECVSLGIGQNYRTIALASDRRVVLSDSAGLLESTASGAIVVTGSHGGLLGGRSTSAIKIDVRAAVFNDACGGINDAGCSRLSALDSRRIPAATVSAWSARIGDAASSFEDGFISRLNTIAIDLGCTVGTSVQDFVDRVFDAGQEASE